MDGGQQRHLAAADAESVQLAAEVPVEMKKDWAQSVGDGHGVERVSAWGRCLVDHRLVAHAM